MIGKTNGINGQNDCAGNHNDGIGGQNYGMVRKMLWIIKMMV